MKVPFSKLSKKNKRIEVAKDVLKQIRLELYKARHLVTLKLPSKLYKELDALKYNPEPCQLQEKLISNKKPCACCARGAVFMSLIRKGNDYTVQQHLRSDIDGKLSDIFSWKQIGLIEEAFEGWDTPRAIRFHKNYKNATQRLTAIMKNIIANKGTFKP